MAKTIDEIEQEKNGDTKTSLLAHGMTVRLYDGVGLRLLRRDDFAPRVREPFSDEYVELLVYVDNSTRSNSAVAIAIVYDTRDFPQGEMHEVARKIGVRFDIHHVVDLEHDGRNPYKRVIRFTLWKGCCDRVPPVDTLIHILDAAVPMTAAILRSRAWRMRASSEAYYGDRAAK